MDDPGWNNADLCEAFAAAVPDRDAVVQGVRRLRWEQFDRRARGVAARLLAAGLGHQDRVALYLHNSPEYLESYVGALKASMVPVNTNHRYLDDEIVFLWDDADAAAVVFHGQFSALVERVRDRVPKVRVWLWVDDGHGTCPSFATPYEAAAATEPVPSPWPRSGNDLVFVYTGGTTGLPKGVMWRQRDLTASITDGAAGVADHVESWAARQRRVVLPAPPLMHGTGMMTAMRGLLVGGTVVLLESHRFDPVEAWATIEREHVGLLSVVGDAFARPLLDALDAEPGRWDLGSLRSIISAGAMFSEPVKQGLLRHHPGLKLVDQLGSSENANAAHRVHDGRSGGASSSTGSFTPAPGVRVIGDDGRDVEPGSGHVGVIAIPGGAVGYHKDHEKSARTFPVIDGRRYTVAGDYATVEAGGSLRLLGRGSVCINTGGEKVFPEEVEEVLKAHADVIDAIVVGVPHERFGQTIAAVLEIAGGATDDDLVDHVKSHLAGYKAPRHIIRVDSVGRAPNGKADYPATQALAVARLAQREVHSA